MILDELLELIKLLGYPVCPFGAEKSKGDCIVYNLIPLMSDMVKEQNRFEVTIISSDFVKGVKMLEEVKATLLTFGDIPKSDSILEINLNGGGSLENLETNTFHFKAFFIVKSRYRKE